MKKKLAVLVLTLLAVVNSYGAEEVKKDVVALPFTNWDFSGSKVDFKAALYDTRTGAVKVGKEEDFILQVKKALDDKTFFQIKYDTRDSNPDTIVELLVNRKFNKNFEAQADVDLTLTTGVSLAEDADSTKVWVKYYQNDKLTWKFAPYDIDLGMGKDYCISNECSKLTGSVQPSPGVQLDAKISDILIVYGGVGAKAVKDTGSLKEKTGFGIKAGMEFKPNKTASLKMALSTNTQSDKTVITLVNPIKTAGSLIGSIKGEKLKFDMEGLYEKYNKASGKDTSDYAILAKLKYNMGEISKGVKFGPYIKGRAISKNALFDDIDYSAVITGSKIAGHGGLKVAEIGTEFELLGGMVINPYFEMLKAGNDIFSDRDGNTNKKGSAFNFSTRVKAMF